jgi:hypothetical protein
MRFTSVLCLLLAVVWAGSTTIGQPAPPAPPAAPAPAAAPRAVDPKADDVLRKMGQSLQAAKTFSFEVDDAVDELLTNGQKVQFGKHVKVLVRRPDALMATVDGDLEQMQYVYHGSQLAIVNRKDKCYALQDVPRNIDAMFDFMAERFGITATLSDLCFSDPYKAMTEHLRSGAYLGLHQVNGVKCHHLAFRQDVIDWQIWVEDSESAVPRKIVITFKEQPGHPQFTAFIDKWDLSAQATDAAFEFTPPGDCKRIDLTPVGGQSTSEKK